MNKLLKFSSDVKPRAALYCMAILFLVSIMNIIFDFYTVSVFMILQIMMVSLVIALIEYFLFLHYDKLSNSKRNLYTLLWAFSINVFIIASAIIFHWVDHLPLYINFILIVIMEIGLGFLRYTIYLKYLYDTKALNEKLKQYQNQRI